MKLNERHTRMLQTLGLHWLPLEHAPSGQSLPSTPNAPAPAPAAPQKAASHAQKAFLAPNQPVVQDSTTSVAPISIVSRATLEGTDWPALHQQIASCQACVLHRNRRQTVPGDGAHTARVLVLGEAPGAEEDAQGLAFAGQSGQLLNHMLAALGWHRSAADGSGELVYVTHTLKCRPSGDRHPEASELAECGAFLQRQVQLLKPQLIIALGKLAVQQTLGSNEALGKLRGRVHAATIGGHATQVVVSYEPSYLLRYPADKARAWEDLVLAADTLENTPT